jgi:pantoate--beta-alanine ligase
VTSTLPVLGDPDAMRAWSDRARVAGQRVAMVPTMGALHAGHLELVRVATGLADVVVVSIFVNPLQFNRVDDFAAYPQPLDDDLRACALAGVGAVYAPTAGAMYPSGFQTHVEPGVLAKPLEGQGRAGHFRGVATVVCKLFGAARPHVAVFGQKDFQQLAVVRAMAADLDTGVDIVGVPTVREADGVALSSRNRRLSGADRAAAVCIPRALGAAREAFTSGERRVENLAASARAVLDVEPLATVEYLSINDASTLVALEPDDVLSSAAVLSTAVWFGEVRLIDNVVLDTIP